MVYIGSEFFSIFDFLKYIEGQQTRSHKKKEHIDININSVYGFYHPF